MTSIQSPSRHARLSAEGGEESAAELRSGSNRDSAKVVVVERPSGLGAYLAEWDDLARNAVEPNIFYESWMLLPAWEEFTTPLVRVTLVFGPADADGRIQLIGLFPLVSSKGYRRFPLNIVSLWRHLHCPLCTPLVRKGYELSALAGFFEWLDSADLPDALVEFEHIAGDGPFFEHLERFLRKTGRRYVEGDRFERAVLRPNSDGKAYVEHALAGKRRKELRRQFNRLSEQGRLEILELQPSDNIDSWLEQYFTLEMASWKGKAGTALSIREGERKYFERISRSAFERRQLMMLKMQLDGVPIAMKYNFVAGEGAYAAKIAFDEKYHQYSPGVQLELQNISAVHDRRTIRWMDSCAMPNHFMIERLWTERRLLRSLAISRHRMKGDVVLRLLPSLERIYRKLKRKE